MGGSTNTVLHLLAIANEAGVDFTMDDIDRISRRVPCLAKVAPNSTNLPHRGRPPRRRHPGTARRARPRRPARHTTSDSRPLADTRCDDIGWTQSDVRSGIRLQTRRSALYLAAPGGVRTTQAFSPANALRVPRRPTAPTAASATSSTPTPKDGGLAVLYRQHRRRTAAIVKTAGVDESHLPLQRATPSSFESQEEAVDGILGKQCEGRRRRRHQLRGAQGRPRHAGDALPDLLHQVAMGLGKECALHHRRPLLRWHLRHFHRSRLPGGRSRRRDRPRAHRRRDRNRRQQPRPARERERRGARAPPRRRRATRPWTPVQASRPPGLRRPARLRHARRLRRQGRRARPARAGREGSAYNRGHAWRVQSPRRKARRRRHRRGGGPPCARERVGRLLPRPRRRAHPDHRVPRRGPGLVEREGSGRARGGSPPRGRHPHGRDPRSRRHRRTPRAGRRPVVGRH